METWRIVGGSVDLMSHCSVNAALGLVSMLLARFISKTEVSVYAILISSCGPFQTIGAFGSNLMAVARAR